MIKHSRSVSGQCVVGNPVGLMGGWERSEVVVCGDELVNGRFRARTLRYTPRRNCFVVSSANQCSMRLSQNPKVGAK